MKIEIILDDAFETFNGHKVNSYWSFFSMGIRVENLSTHL